MRFFFALKHPNSAQSVRVPSGHRQKECIIDTLHGEKIAVIMTADPYDGVCHIPVLPEARALLD